MNSFKNYCGVLLWACTADFMAQLLFRHASLQPPVFTGFLIMDASCVLACLYLGLRCLLREADAAGQRADKTLERNQA